MGRERRMRRRREESLRGIRETWERFIYREMGEREKTCSKKLKDFAFETKHLGNNLKTDVLQ